MAHDLVSILMPTYNVKPYIREAVDSVLRQTYPSIELIIVDDASNDGTYEELVSLCATDGRVKLFRNPRNLRIAKTLNRALEFARGKFIGRMDGDDTCERDRIERQVDYLERHPGIDLVGMHVNGIDENGTLLNRSRYLTNEKWIYRAAQLVSPVAHVWVARREAYERLNGYREFSGAEDYDFLLRMITTGMRFCNLDYHGYSVRIRNGNTTSTSGLRQRRLARLIVKLYKERLSSGHETKVYTTDLERYLKNSDALEWMHACSNNLLNRAIKYRASRRYISVGCATFAAMVLSPYQADYIVRKMLYRLIVKFQCGNR